MKKAQFVDWPCSEELPKGKKKKSVVVWTTPAKYIAAWTYIPKYESRKEEEDGRDNEDR